MDMVKSIEMLSLSEISPNPTNPRKHPAAQIKSIARSIQAFGFNNPLLIRNGMVIAGHGRRLAALELGMDEVPVIKLDHLTTQEAQAYIIADNKLALNSEWDWGLLVDGMGDLAAEGDFDMSLLGFDEEELDYVYGGGGTRGEKDIDTDTGLPKGKEVTCPECSHQWTLFD